MNRDKKMLFRYIVIPIFALLTLSGYFSHQSTIASSHFVANDFSLILTVNIEASISLENNVTGGSPFDNSGLPSYKWEVVTPGIGPLADGLSLSQRGFLTGRPITEGTFSTRLRIIDKEGVEVFATMTTAISATSVNPFVANDFNLTKTAGITISENLNPNVTGGTPPYSWDVVSGELPPGLNLSNAGILTGTPTTAGTYQTNLGIGDGSASMVVVMTTTVSTTTTTTPPPPPPPPPAPPPNSGINFTGVDLSIDDVVNLVERSVCFVYRIAGSLIAIMLAVVGIRYLTSSGNETKIGEVNKAFKWVIIGAIVVLGVGVIIATISTALGVPALVPIVC